MSGLAVTKKYEKMTREQLEEERQKLKEAIAGPNMYSRIDSEHMRRVTLYKKAICVEKLLFGDEAAKKLQDELYEYTKYKALTADQKEEKYTDHCMAPVLFEGYLSPYPVGRWSGRFGFKPNGTDHCNDDF